MNKLIYILLAVSIIFSACEDEDQQPTSISILGSWESIEWKVYIVVDIGLLSLTDKK